MFSALLYMPLVDVTAIRFVQPLILTILGVFVLQESIGIRRSLALLAGFIGTMIVIRPSLQTVGFPAFLSLLAAFCVAGCVTITRSRATSEAPHPM